MSQIEHCREEWNDQCSAQRDKKLQRLKIYLLEKHQSHHYSSEGISLAWLKNVLGPVNHII